MVTVSVTKPDITRTKFSKYIYRCVTLLNEQTSKLGGSNKVTFLQQQMSVMTDTDMLNLPLLSNFLGNTIIWDQQR